MPTYYSQNKLIIPKKADKPINSTLPIIINPNLAPRMIIRQNAPRKIRRIIILNSNREIKKSNTAFILPNIEKNKSLEN